MSHYSCNLIFYWFLEEKCNPNRSEVRVSWWSSQVEAENSKSYLWTFKAEELFSLMEFPSVPLLLLHYVPFQHCTIYISNKKADLIWTFSHSEWVNCGTNKLPLKLLNLWNCLQMHCFKKQYKLFNILGQWRFRRKLLKRGRRSYFQMWIDIDLVFLSVQQQDGVCGIDQIVSCYWRSIDAVVFIRKVYMWVTFSVC